MLGGLTPPSRYLAATARSGGKAYIFGGGGHGLNDTWELDFAIKKNLDEVCEHAGGTVGSGGCGV